MRSVSGNLSKHVIARAVLSAARCFYVVGWQCDAEGCRSNPRDLGPDLRFDAAASSAALESAKRLSKNSNVMFNCAIRRDRLVACQIADDTLGSAEAVRVALRIAGSVRLVAPNPAKPRAIVSVQYEVGPCPTWQCVIEPPPPSPVR